MRGPSYVIAEAGSSGDGDRDKMLRMIGIAAERGADAVKMQWTSSADQMGARRRAGAYTDHYLRYLQWPTAWHEAFAREAASVGIDYMCTVYLTEDVAAVAPFVKHFKVSSFESSDPAFVAAHVPYAHHEGKEVIVSAGLSTAADVARMKQTITVRDGAVSRTMRARVLQCVSAYPAPLESLNLATIRANGFDGFSDHSEPRHTFTGGWAVLAGAEIIEAHLKGPFTSDQNPDAPHSMTAIQFGEYVHQIRQAERAIGDGVKRVQPAEEQWQQYRVRQP